MLFSRLILRGFRATSRRGFFLLSLGCTCFGHRCLGTVLGYMSGIATKEAKVVVEPTLMFLGHQFTVFAKLQRKIGSGFLGLGSGALSRAGILLFG